MQGRSDPNRELLDAAALVGHLVPEGTVHRFLAEHRHRLFPDELFADLFGSGRGGPSVPADVIATVLVLQSLEGAELDEARRARRDGDYRRWRPMVERTLAWLVRPGRRVAYRGTTRNRIWLAHRTATTNLQRLVNLGLNHRNGWQLAT